MNKLFLLIIIAALIVGCKKIYEPDVDAGNASIAIDGVLTNNTKLSRVIITRPMTFSNSNMEQFISGAIVKVYDNDGLVYNLSETSKGKYSNPSLIAVDGKSYFLEVIAPDGNVYRSETESLPPKVTVDSIFGEIINKKFTGEKNSETLIEKKVLQPYFDLTNSIPEIPKCRFNLKNTIVSGETVLSGVSYRWTTVTPFPEISNYPKYPTNSNNQIKKSPLSYLYKEVKNYALPGYLVGFVLFIDKYDLNPGTFEYYKGIKQQSEYTGKIFDAVPTQIKGNITCVNNPEKITLGKFEVSNAEQFIYICNISSSSDVFFLKKDMLIGFTEFGRADSLPKFLR